VKNRRFSELGYSLAGSSPAASDYIFNKGEVRRTVGSLNE